MKQDKSPVASEVLWCPLQFPHKTMFGSSLSPVVSRRALDLFTLLVFVYSGVQHILCLFLFCFSSPYVPYVPSFSWLFIFDCPSIFSNIYFPNFLKEIQLNLFFNHHDNESPSATIKYMINLLLLCNLQPILLLIASSAFWIPILSSWSSGLNLCPLWKNTRAISKSPSWYRASAFWNRPYK